MNAEMDAIAAFIVVTFFFFLGVGVQHKNPKLGASIYRGWKAITRKLKRKDK